MNFINIQSHQNLSQMPICWNLRAKDKSVNDMMLGNQSEMLWCHSWTAGIGKMNDEILRVVSWVWQNIQLFKWRSSKLIKWAGNPECRAADTDPGNKWTKVICSCWAKIFIELTLRDDEWIDIVNIERLFRGFCQRSAIYSKICRRPFFRPCIPSFCAKWSTEHARIPNKKLLTCFDVHSMHCTLHRCSQANIIPESEPTSDKYWLFKLIIYNAFWSQWPFNPDNNSTKNAYNVQSRIFQHFHQFCLQYMGNGLPLLLSLAERVSNVHIFLSWHTIFVCAAVAVGAFRFRSPRTETIHFNQTIALINQIHCIFMRANVTVWGLLFLTPYSTNISLGSGRLNRTARRVSNRCSRSLQNSCHSALEQLFVSNTADEKKMRGRGTFRLNMV